MLVSEKKKNLAIESRDKGLFLRNFHDTVDYAFNELGYNEISGFLNIHFFITDVFNKDVTMQGDKLLFFLGPLNFAK